VPCPIAKPFLGVYYYLESETAVWKRLIVSSRHRA
jgi:hypothetical protein